MRGLFWAFVVFAVVVVAYCVWPLVGAAQLAATVQGGPPAAIVQRIDLPALRRSLAHQIVAAYLRQNEKLSRMNGLAQSLAGGVGASVADSILEDMLTPDNIAAMLKDGRMTAGKIQASAGVRLPKLGSIGADQGITMLLNSYFDGPTSFVVPLSSGAETYGVHLHLSGTTWMLSGLDLPTSLVDRLAREAAERQKKES